MTKDVLITIRGMQFEGVEDPESVEVIQRGQYYQRNGSHYLLYEEPVEGTDEIIVNRIKFNEKEVQVSKKGAINTMLSFRENEKNMTNYATPYGNLLMGLDTHRINLKINENDLQVFVEYALDVNYEFLADCEITITAASL